jgi:hypothetical protein
MSLFICYPPFKPARAAVRAAAGGVRMLFGKGVLPDANTMGTINPHTLTLELHCASRPGLEVSLRGDGDNTSAQVLAHELCHWTDLLGTVWGQSYLDVVFSAFDRVQSAADIVDTFPHALALFDADRSILFPTYYKVVSPAAAATTDKKPWALTTSCGASIDTAGRLDEARPIFFVRFAETLSGPQVARQPLTVGTLLELRAVAAEIATFSAWLTQQSSEQQLVAATLFKRERLATFYDPASTTYTAAAHLLSNCSKENEFAVVCALGARLAFLCLNAVRKTFERVTLPRIFKAHFTPPRLGGFRRSGERGFLFASLAHHIEEHHFTASSLNLDDLLKAVGLTSAGAAYAQAERWFEQRALRPPPLQSDELRRIRRQLLDFGVVHFRAGLTRSGDPLCMQQFLQHDLPSPSMMTSDCDQFNITSMGISIADSDLLNAINIRVEEATRMALRAGRGLDFGFKDYVY